jgi:hypothetical protein
LTIIKKTKESFSEETTEIKKSQKQRDRYIVLIVNTLNNGEHVKMKSGYTCKIKKPTSIAKKVGSSSTNNSFKQALAACVKKGYILEFLKKKELLKIFHHTWDQYSTYSAPCYVLTEKGIEMITAINLLGNNSMDEIIQNHISQQKGLTEDKINEYLEVFKGIPNQFKILSELETLSTE